MTKIVDYAASHALTYHVHAVDHDDAQRANQAAELVALVFFLLEGTPASDNFKLMLGQRNSLAPEQV